MKSTLRSKKLRPMIRYTNSCEADACRSPPRVIITNWGHHLNWHCQICRMAVSGRSMRLFPALTRQLQPSIACHIAAAAHIGRPTNRRFDRLTDNCTLSVYTTEQYMKHVGIRQARQNLPDLIDRAEAGEEVIITRQGRPVAKLIAAPRDPIPLPSLVDFRARVGRSGTAAVQLIRDERDAQ